MVFRSKRNTSPRISAITLCVRRAGSLLIALIFMGVVSINLQAQQWEWVYGDTPRLEEGFDVAPILVECVRGASSDPLGYVEVGTTDPLDGSDKDIYVVKTDESGAQLWEKTFDLGNNVDDIAYGVIENRHGHIVIVGSTDNSPYTGLNMFILMLDCDGTPLEGGVFSENTQSTPPPPWTNLDDVAYDIVEIYPGTIHSVEYAVVGYAGQPDGTKRAVVMRVDSTAGIVWAKQYWITNGYDYVFNSVDLVGSDIVAGGYQETSTERDGFAVRVNGTIGANGGGMLGGLRGAGLWGKNNQMNDEIQGVAALANPAETGGIAMTGLTGNNNILLARVNNGDFAFGALNGVEYSIAVPGHPTLGSYGIGYDIVEVPPLSGTPPVTQTYDIALTGKTTYPDAFDFDAFLFTYRNPFNAGPPAAIIANRYGGGSNDEGRGITAIGPTASLSMANEFGIGGSTLSDLGATNDVGDMYLIRANYAGCTGCQMSASEAATQVYIHHTEIASLSDWGMGTALERTPTNRDWGIQVCFPGMCKPIPNIRELEITESAIGASIDEIEGTTAMVIQKGDILHYNGKNMENFGLKIYNAQGSYVGGEEYPVNDIRISTEGWSTGVYFAQFERSGTIKTITVIVTD